MTSLIDNSLMRIFADVFQVPIESISPDSSPETIESWDSLQHLNLVLALEQEFAVQFSPDEIEKLVSPRLVSTFLSEKLAVPEAVACQ